MSMDVLNEAVSNSLCILCIVGACVQCDKVLPGSFCYCDRPVHVQGGLWEAEHAPIDINAHPPQDKHA